MQGLKSIFDARRLQVTCVGSFPCVLGSFSSQNSYCDCYGSFDEQQLFSVKFARDVCGLFSVRLGLVWCACRAFLSPSGAFLSVSGAYLACM